MTKTKPETRKEAANSVTSLASSAPKRGKTLWVEMSIYPTERKGSFKLVNERALDKHGFKPVLGGYVSKMVLEHLRAAQPSIIDIRSSGYAAGWNDCVEKNMPKARAEGYAEAMTKFNSMREVEKEKIRAEGIMQGRKLQETEDRADCQKCVWNKSVRREAQKQEARKE